MTPVAADPPKRLARAAAGPKEPVRRGARAAIILAVWVRGFETLPCETMGR
jgi:hypothetical protein